MKVAITVWNGRISPVFDAACEMEILELSDNRVAERRRVLLKEETPVGRVAQLRVLHVTTVICGAISRPLAAMLNAGGIQVIGFVTGDANAALRAFLNDELPRSDFLMPGCRADGSRCRNRYGKTLETIMVNGRKGRSRAGGRGQRGGRGRMGGPLAGGQAGSCVCPKCNESVVHERGIPCSEQQCPRCGTALVRA